ncbi:unnamed protein product [Triticum turgidum subsp. durum]|uniref:Uncharacterized protein n=1 Tax=Triticum turgidum subsp. durum TaxID=4567 RepID=A0A9R0T2W0_TRITD|nr:unnamed protein product [Triticum turgidum subsp. durum]
MVEWTCRGEEGGRREWEGLVGSLLMVLEIARIVQSGFRSVCCSYKLTQVLIGVDLPPHDFPYNHDFSWLGCSDPPPHRLPHPHRQRPSWHRPAAGAMAKKPLPSSSDGCRHAVLRTYALMTRLAQGLTNQHATSLLVDKRSNRHIYKTNHCVRSTTSHSSIFIALAKQVNPKVQRQENPSKAWKVHSL